MGKPLILMVEDEEETAFLSARALKRQGCEVLLAVSAAEARELAQNHTPDLFILDVELPDGNGFALCEEIRQRSDAPVLFLTGRKTLQDKIRGITLGGDYYMTKPFHADEFSAIAARLLKRAEEMREKLDRAVREATKLSRGPLTLYLPESRASVNGRDAQLTAKEFAVLLMLVRSEGKELSGKQLYESIWGSPMNDDSNAIRKHVQRLKKKLDTDNTDGFDIITLYGGGFVFTTK